MTAGAPRVVALLAGAGLLLAATPAAGAPRDEEAALGLLADAAAASRALTYSGTKYVASWHATSASTALVDVAHRPGRGAVVEMAPTPGAPTADAVVLATDGLRPRLLEALGEEYELVVAGDGRCTGRDAVVVEARRTDADATVAGRFWVDEQTGLLLRREVYDEAGNRLRSSAFVELSVSASPSTVRASRTLRRDTVDAAALQDAGWPLPEQLPGGFVLFAADDREDGVVHASYSDGLSTTSLFLQRGRLGDRPDRFVERRLGGEPVWVHDGLPERVVWSGGGRVWTLVSDAPEDVVARAVAALPHEDLPGTGLRHRLARGLSRLKSMLLP